MFEVEWQEITTSGKFVMKRKSFKTDAALHRFIEKLYDKDGFWQICCIMKMASSKYTK